MDITTTLERCGLALHGDPPRTSVAVGDGSAEVEVSEQDTGAVLVRASVPAPRGADDEALRAVSLTAPGDQRFRITGAALVAERHLVEPTAGELYDRVHEVAKSVVHLGRVLAEIAGLEQVLDRDDAPPPIPEPAPVTPDPAAGAPPTPSPAPTAPAAASSPPASGGPVWFYVDAPTPMYDSNRNVVATLEPGRWHRVVAEQGSWVHAVADSGAQGWVERHRVRRA